MYIYGKNVVKQSVLDNENIKKIFVYKNFKDNELIELIKKNYIPIKYVDKTFLDKKVSAMHQGIVAEVADFEYQTFESLNNDSFLVMLDHLEDPHNLGAIIRTCEAAKVDAIIIPKNRSVSVNSTVIKVSTGAINNIKIVQVVNLAQTLEKLKQNNFWIVGTNMNGTPYYDIDYKGKCCIVIGNEGKGMSNIVKEKCDFIASIPMLGTTNSLNASVATGIVVFEAVKQRK